VESATSRWFLHPCWKSAPTTPWSTPCRTPWPSSRCPLQPTARGASPSRCWGTTAAQRVFKSKSKWDPVCVRACVRVRVCVCVFSLSPCLHPLYCWCSHRCWYCVVPESEGCSLVQRSEMPSTLGTGSWRSMAFLWGQWCRRRWVYSSLASLILMKLDVVWNESKEAN